MPELGHLLNQANRMATFSVHEAKTHLSRLIEMVLTGEEVVIARNKVPVVRNDLRPAHAANDASYRLARRTLTLMPSRRYLVGMAAPLLSVRSAKARDLAHELARKERRPIRAMVEDALADYAGRHSPESAAEFLERMRTLGLPGDGSNLDAATEEHRAPHQGIDH